MGNLSEGNKQTFFQDVTSEDRDNKFPQFKESESFVPDSEVINSFFH